MCGLLGVYTKRANFSSSNFELMLNTLDHRGPDGFGIMEFDLPLSTLSLGHKRLSIIDTSEGGRQPMSFEHLHIVFNGEIYNFQEIKSELQSLGYSFSTGSDTEVILLSFHKWGKKCVDRFSGMFAFAIFNEKNETLSICRDRIGVKPMYYHLSGDLFMFASELKAFHSCPIFNAEISNESLLYFLQYGFIPNPYSIFKNTFKLEPGSWLEVNLVNLNLKKEKYWSIDDCFKKSELNLSYYEAQIELEALIKKAANLRMVADVPIGIFLSGGYDSSYITALLQSERAQKLKTFTIGFPDGKDESFFAKEIANFIGTDHCQLDCTKQQAKQIIPDLCYFFDEPCADISAIPTILVSRMASSSVKVVLSADGGDELFAGYNGYRDNLRRLDLIKSIPMFMTKPLSKLAYGASWFLADCFTEFNHKTKGLAQLFSAKEIDWCYHLLRNSTKVPDYYINKLLSSSPMPEFPILDSEGCRTDLSVMQLFDLKWVLPDLLLSKIDRATMSASIEGREPLLDHSLIELAARLPQEFLVSQASGKVILKELTHKLIPKILMSRPKVGFDLPIFEWLRTDLSYLIDENLSETELAKHGLFESEMVNEIVRLFRENKLIYNDIVWRLIQFQMWFNKWSLPPISKI